MLESIYKCSWKLESIRQCWLRKPINDYLTHLASQGYSKASIRNNAYMLLRFATFVRRHGSCKIKDLPKWAGSFVQPFQNYGTHQMMQSLVGRFIHHLQERAVVPATVLKTPCLPFSKIADKYERYLLEHCGLNSRGIADRKSYIQKFLQYAHDSGVKNLKSIDGKIIQQFMISEGPHYSRNTMSTNSSKLRRFLAYLYNGRRITQDLTTIVITPRIYKYEGCPRFLTSSEIKKLLSFIDRRTKIGKRDYAILILLATYGLRGIEAVRLQLRDINWREEKIYIRNRKTGKNSIYPLAQSVGNAILSYLRWSRAKSNHQEVFLTCSAPYRPFCSKNIRWILRKYLRLASLDVDRAGAHTLRYSCAQKLFNDNFSIKVIGDYLGHSALNTTMGYMKIDIRHLREVALDNEEVFI